MIILIAGASHSGKTAFAQRLLERYGYQYLSIGHLKMGLIRSGQTPLTPDDDDALVDYLWPIVREMVETAIENGQHLIIEGCYIPFDWARDFEPRYLAHIRYRCIVLTERYIRAHFDDVLRYANVIERRVDDSSCTMRRVIDDNALTLAQARAHGVDILLVDDDYDVDVDLDEDIVMDEAQRCERIAMIRNGRVNADGSPERICERTRTATLEEAFLALERGRPRALSRCMPLTYGVDVLRDVMLRGEGWGTVWPDLLALFVFLAAFFVLGAVGFRKRRACG